MRRVARIIAGVSIAVATAAVVLPLTIDLDKAQRRSAERLSRLLARPVTFTEPFRLHLLPIPILTTGPVLIGDPEAPVAQVGGVTSRLAVAPLLAGLVEPAELTLERPSLRLPGSQFQLDWLTLSRQSFSSIITGELKWGAHVASLSASVGGDDGTGPATLSVRLPSAGASLDFGGTISPLANARALHGKLTAVAADLVPLGGPPQTGLKIEAELAAGGGEITLSDVKGEMGGAPFSAALAAAHGDPAMIDLSVKLSKLDLDQWIGRPPVSSAQAPSEPAPPAAPSGMDASLQPANDDTGFVPKLSLPSGIFANVGILVDSLAWRGQSFSQVALEATLEQGTVLLRKVRATREDGVRASLEGVLSAADGLPRFEGALKLSQDKRSASANVQGTWPDIILDDVLVRDADRISRGRLALRLGQSLSMQAKAETSPIGPFALSGLVTPSAGGLDIHSLRLSWRGLDLAGRISAAFDGSRPRIEADLATDFLDIDRLAKTPRHGRLMPGNFLFPPTQAPAGQPIVPAAVRPAPSSNGPWSQEPLDLSSLQAFDAKLTLSALTLASQGLRLDSAKARLSVENGTAILESLTGQLWSGAFSASGRLSGAAQPALTGQWSLTGANAGAIGLGVGDIKVTDGRVDAQARFTTAGRTTQEMAARLAGDGRMNVTDGVVSGFDLPAIHRRLADIRSLGNVAALVQSGLGGGKTRFSSLAGTMQAKDGIAVTRDLKLTADGGSAAVDSSIDLPRWSTATAVAVRIGDSSTPPLVVRLDGPIDNPRKVIDANAIQRYLVEKGLGRNLNKGGGDGDGDKPNGRRILQELFRGLGGRQN